MSKKKPDSALNDFSAWVGRKRKEKGWSLDHLARELEKQGYPISKNKLWRIEHISESNLKKIDLELKVRLESIFCESFTNQAVDYSKDELFLLIIDLIDKWKKDPFSITMPHDPLLRKVYLHLIG